MKKSKKGFTLVEMLVVIAIIAVLVAIIVPTVTSSTKKAKAATDAANLRSALATATIKALEGIPTGGKQFSATDLNVPANSKYNESWAFSCTASQTAAGATASTSDTGLDVVVKYGDHGVNFFAALADGKNETEAAAADTTTTTGGGNQQQQTENQG